MSINEFSSPFGLPAGGQVRNGARTWQIAVTICYIFITCSGVSTGTPEHTRIHPVSHWFSKMVYVQVSLGYTSIFIDICRMLFVF